MSARGHAAAIISRELLAFCAVYVRYWPLADMQLEAFVIQVDDIQCSAECHHTFAYAN